MNDRASTGLAASRIGRGRARRRSLVKWAGVALVVAVVLSAAIGPALAQEATATVTAVKGTVELQAPSSDAWVLAQSGARMDVGTRVRTGSGSTASIAIAEGVTAQLGAQTEICLIDDGTLSAEREPTILIEQFEGHIELELRLKAHHYLKSEVVTPHAAVNMRTQFRFRILKVSVGPDGTDVEVLAGEADVVAEGTTMALKPGQSVSVPVGGEGQDAAVSVVTVSGSALDLSSEAPGDGSQVQERDRDRDQDQPGGGSADGGCDEPPCGEANPQGPTGPNGPNEPNGPNGPNDQDEQGEANGSSGPQRGARPSGSGSRSTSRRSQSRGAR